MKPILYAQNETDFAHNGIGTLAETASCTVSEERNGTFELELKYPVDGRLYGYIEEGCIVKAKPNDISNAQLFYIYRSTKPFDGFVTFYGEHISYELSGNPVEGVEIENEIAQNAMEKIFSSALLPHNYTAYSDIVKRKGTSIARASVRAALGGVAGSVLSVWGGEYEFDNFTVKLHSSRGRQTGIKIAYGKNLTDLQQEKNISEVYCGVFAYAKYTPQSAENAAEKPEEVVVTLSEKIVWSPHAAAYARKRVCIKDFSDRFNGASAITETELREVVNAWVAESGFDVPKVSITVSFVNLWNSPECEKYALLERVNLCDTVSVEFPKLGVSTTAKIVKTKYDVLNEKYLTLTLGNAKANFADTVNQTAADIAQTRKEAKETSAAIEVDIRKAVDEATQAITGQSGGYVVLNPPKNPQEILIMDAPTIAEAKKIWRWNSGGLGYSKNGYNGSFGTAITQDGAIVADYITVGKVGALNIDVAGVIKAGSLAVLGDVQIEATRATGAETALSGRITVNAENIAAEVTRATNTEGTLSSRITATAEDITAEVTRATDAETALSSRIISNANAITAKVSQTGGSPSSFAWTLTSLGFTLTANSTEVMKVTSSGLEVTGKVTATSGTLENLTINGRLYFGGNDTYYIDANENDEDYYVNLPGLKIDERNGAVFAGTLSAAGGTFAGELSAATGTFSGELRAATGSFSGTITSNNANITGGKISFGKEDDYAKIDASGAKFGERWNGMQIMYSSIRSHWSDWDCYLEDGLNSLHIGSIPDWWGTGMPIHGIEAVLDTSDCTYFTIGASNGPNNLGSASIGFNMNSDYTKCYAQLIGTWKGSLTAVSDRNLKHDIEKMPEKYDTFFNALIPVRYKYNSGTSGRYHTGFIAQDVEKAILNAGMTTNEAALYVQFTEIKDVKNHIEEQTYGLRYEEFVSLNTWQIQLLKARVAELEKKLSTQGGQI